MKPEVKKTSLEFLLSVSHFNFIDPILADLQCARRIIRHEKMMKKKKSDRQTDRQKSNLMGENMRHMENIRTTTGSISFLFDYIRYYWSICVSGGLSRCMLVYLIAMVIALHPKYYCRDAAGLLFFLI